MAGGAHHALKHDPAIDRWYQMRENQYLKFRWTKHAVRTGLVLMVGVPLGLYFVLGREDNRYSWTAARKGQSLLRNPPPAPAEENDS
ncbi:hypothetical protein M422DRAFT_259828 [Sphaerobolus stellatus SS14]|uniref:NADH dehydrogenase [ubiquinone] 1 beta subcomplex subunit 4 n=1 Tax=Sphaerobolus stellatus (strain SS14) TaxID=990650 RepID=A0A0C9VJV4_SPHS4|nr:hypothetical protein M422DRAFT_259828 [Sphaerobolus stellatus SS14]